MDEYFLRLTVPANTPSSSPASSRLEVEGDYVYEIAYFIPPGHAGLTGLRVYYGDLQLLPRNVDEWIRGDGIYRSITTRWRFGSRRTTLTFKAFNDDDTYEHSFYIYVVTASVDEVLSTARLEKVFAPVARFLKRMVGV